MMKVEDVKVKMDAAYDKWQKRLATTQKFRDRMEKNWQIIVKNGWDKYLQENGEFNPWEVQRITSSDKAFDITYKYNDAKDAIVESEKKEPEVEKVYRGWVEKYNNALKFTAEVEEMPEIFKQVIALLATEWTAWDVNDRERMKKMRAELPAYKYGMTKEEREEYTRAHNNYRKAFPITRENELKQSDEYLYKKNEDEATMYMKDLIHRIKNRVGEITNLENIHFVGKALNGYVEGTLGKAYIDTILAGGYNIQRLHYRVLVK